MPQQHPSDALDGTTWVRLDDGAKGTIATAGAGSFAFLGTRYERAGPTQAGHDGLRLSAFYDGWKLASFRRYKPLVYWCAFGQDKSIEMLRLGLLSLIEFGGYDGDVLIISDRSRSAIARFVPEALERRWHLFEYQADDMLAYTWARYDIHRWPAAYAYQPLLYVDTDVIFDAPVDPLLVRLAGTDRIIGQGNAGPLWRDMGVGAHLLAEDGFVFDDEQGFCSGTLAMPNVISQTEDLALIREAVERYATARRDRGIGWYDQPTANYVLYKRRGPCPPLLDAYVRWGGKSALHGGDRPRGMVHLWGGADKLAEMRELIALLRGDQTASDWAIYGAAGRMDAPDLAAHTKP